MGGSLIGLIHLIRAAELTVLNTKKKNFTFSVL